MNALECKLLEYAALFSGKVLWGLDCDLNELKIELEKLYKYLYLTRSLETVNECTHIPISLQQKIDSYVKALGKKKTAFCRNC